MDVAWILEQERDLNITRRSTALKWLYFDLDTCSLAFGRLNSNMLWGTAWHMHFGLEIRCGKFPHGHFGTAKQDRYPDFHHLNLNEHFLTISRKVKLLIQVLPKSSAAEFRPLSKTMMYCFTSGYILLCLSSSFSQQRVQAKSLLIIHTLAETCHCEFRCVMH